ncbi:MAG: ribonuclease E activity regulator RraA [Pseudomonadota bacterium]
MKTADLIDDHADSLALIHLPFRKFGRADFCMGQVETLSCFEDNALLKQTVGLEGQGRVLVVDGGGSTRKAIVGDMVADIAKTNGWAGLVLNGAIRDSIDIGAMDYAVFALGTSPVKSTKSGRGTVGTDLSMGETLIRSGQWIYADADGVLISDIQLD